jgi:hypothetical protein
MNGEPHLRPITTFSNTHAGVFFLDNPLLAAWRFEKV